MSTTRAVKHRARDAAIIVIMAVFLGVLLEIGTRVVDRLRSHRWSATKAAEFDAEIHRVLTLYRRHPFLNTAPRAGASAAAFGKRASFNSQGYRSPERPSIKPPGATRILCSGGSTTFDISAADDAATWPWRIETTLRSRGRNVEVFNAGFPGWTSLENLISLAIRDLDMAPDVVILYQGINDLQPASHRPFDRQYEHGHAEIAARALGFGLRPLKWFDHSLFVEKSRELLFGEEDQWRSLRSAPVARGLIPEIPTEAVTTFKRNVRSYVSIATAAGAKVVLVTQSIRVRGKSVDADLDYLAHWIEGLEPTEASEQLDRFNEVLRCLSLEGPALLIDVAEEVPWEDGDFADPMHFSARGSERMATFMADSLERSVLSGIGGESGRS